MVDLNQLFGDPSGVPVGSENQNNSTPAADLVKGEVLSPLVVEEVVVVDEDKVDDVKAEHDRLLARVNELRGDRTEDNIGLNDEYWKALNQLRQHIHNSK